MEGLAVLVIIGIILYATSQGASGDVTTGSFGPGGRRTGAPPGRGAQSGGGGGAGGAAAAAGAAAVIPVIKQILPGSIPRPPSIPPANPVEIESSAASIGVSTIEFASIAGTFNLAPAQLSTLLSEGYFAASMPGGSAALAPASGGLIVPQQAAAAGSQVASFVGWALPVAAALALGTMILKSALSRRGSFGESKGRARGSMERLGKIRAYQAATQIIETIIATGEWPITNEQAVQMGFNFHSWYENADTLREIRDPNVDGARSAALDAEFMERVRRWAAVEMEWTHWFDMAGSAAVDLWSQGIPVSVALYTPYILERVPLPQALWAWTVFRPDHAQSTIDLIVGHGIQMGVGPREGGNA